MTAPRWKVFVISLRRARERRLQVLAQLADTDLPFEIVDAFDARQVRPELLVRAAGAGDLGDGVVAAYSSHLGTLERIVDYGLDYALILEDDFVICESEMLTLRTVWDHFPPDADHIQLYDFKSHFSHGYHVEEKGERFNKLGCTNVISIGYIISNRLAKFILKCHPLPKMPFDCQVIEISRQGIFDFYDVNERLISVKWEIPSEVEANY